MTFSEDFGFCSCRSSAGATGRAAASVDVHAPRAATAKAAEGFYSPVGNIGDTWSLEE
jgi:hypothetical protein